MGSGWLGEYFRGDDVAVVRVDPVLARGFADGVAVRYDLGEAWKGRWKALLTVDRPGEYAVGVSCSGGFVLKIGERVVLDEWHAGGGEARSAQAVHLQAGVYPVRIAAFFPGTAPKPESVEFWWRPPGDAWHRVTPSRLRPDLS